MPATVPLRDEPDEDPTPVALLPEVSEIARLLDGLYDPGALQRGRAYANEGRVELVGVTPGRIRSVCRGSGTATYLQSIQWTGWRPEDFTDTCTCPLGGACKHCVAAILTARREVGGNVRSLHLRREPDWRDALGELGRSDEGASTTRLSLGILVALTQPRQNAYAADASPYVSIRPLREGRSGRWVKSGATWRNLTSAYLGDLADTDPAQVAALRALASAARGGYYLNDQSLPLSQFGPEVWSLLDHAVEVGVTLTGEGAAREVALSATPVRPVVDLQADDTGRVTVTTGFGLDGGRLVLGGGHSGLIGSPAHGLWITDGGRLLLVRLAEPLHPTVARLATSPPLGVPADDVDELLDVYQPALQRHAAVSSSDRSVALTTSCFEQLVLVIERVALDVATATWIARYRRGERQIDHVLHRPFGTGRDRSAEAEALTKVELPIDLLPALVDAAGQPRDLQVRGPDALTLLTQVVPWLEAAGAVTVEMAGSLPPLRESTADPLISIAVRDGDGRRREANDWFDLDVEVSIDGEDIDFASLFRALDAGDEVLILPSGTWLRLDRPELDRLRELIAEAQGLADPSPNALVRLNRFQTSWWDELTGLGVVARQSQRWLDTVGQMAPLSAPEPVARPAGLEAELRHYQQDGLDWLAFLHRHRLGGILADDMGLGKTVQTLALCLHVLEDDPAARFLVVAPTSVVENWAREARRFAPGMAVQTITETQARRGSPLAEATAGANLVVTSYALFRIEHAAYAEEAWELLLLDEAQFVKNHQGKTYQCVRRLEARTKIAITGTPLENSLMDLWSLLSIAAPGLYPDPKRFSETYRKPIESGEAPELLATLQRRIAPLMRRRTKDEVLTELPPKTEQVVEVELSARHARIYATQLQRQRQKVLGLVGDVQKNRFEILKSLTMLRQLALDPGLVDPENDHIGSAKLDRLVEDLTQVVAEGHRALVFSQFTRFLARLRVRLDGAGIAHSYLDGRTRKREEAISRFKDGEVPVFVISLKAGGFGLNLAEADYCFVLDPWWNPATETQAVDRAHRLGQQNPVMVYRYVSTDTIEEKVMELKARKAALFASVMDADGGLSGALTEDDLRGLFDLG